MQLYPRRLTAHIEHSLRTDRVTAVMGPRQAGKTTLVRHLLHGEREPRYYNLKDPGVRQALKENCRREFSLFRDSTIVLDEVQTAPALLEHIQLEVDERPEEKGRFLLLGSNHLLLHRHIKESLAGRVALFTLPPFSLGELLGRPGPTLLERLRQEDSPQRCADLLDTLYLPIDQQEAGRSTLLELNRFGGYPEFISRQAPKDRMDWLANYRQTYLETDLRQLVDLQHSESFEVFEQMFSQRISGLLNISELARDCALSADTVRRFIHYYRQLFVAWQARPWHANAGKRMVKMAKYYYHDTGVLRSITGDFSSGNGRFWENTVLTEIRKVLGGQGPNNTLFFVRSASGVEADGCCASTSGRLTFFIEVKHADKTHSQDCKQLHRYVPADENSIGLLLNMAPTPQRISPRVWALPAAWLLM